MPIGQFLEISKLEFNDNLFPIPVRIQIDCQFFFALLEGKRNGRTGTSPAIFETYHATFDVIYVLASCASV